MKTINIKKAKKWKPPHFPWEADCQDVKISTETKSGTILGFLVWFRLVKRKTASFLATLPSAFVKPYEVSLI